MCSAHVCTSHFWEVQRGLREGGWRGSWNITYVMMGELLNVVWRPAMWKCRLIWTYGCRHQTCWSREGVCVGGGREKKDAAEENGMCSLTDKSGPETLKQKWDGVGGGGVRSLEEDEKTEDKRTEGRIDAALYLHPLPLTLAAQLQMPLCVTSDWLAVSMATHAVPQSPCCLSLPPHCTFFNPLLPNSITKSHYVTV